MTTGGDNRGMERLRLSFVVVNGLFMCKPIYITNSCGGICILSKGYMVSIFL